MEITENLFIPYAERAWEIAKSEWEKRGSDDDISITVIVVFKNIEFFYIDAHFNNKTSAGWSYCYKSIQLTNSEGTYSKSFNYREDLNLFLKRSKIKALQDPTKIEINEFCSYALSWVEDVRFYDVVKKTSDIQVKKTIIQVKKI